MAKLNLKDYNTKRATLGIEDLEEQVAILTLDTVDEIEADDESSATGKRKALVLAFVEAEDRVMWPNRTAIGVLIEKLGDDTDLWIGKKVPVEKVRVPFKGKMYDKVQVVPAAEWEQYLKTSKRRK